MPRRNDNARRDTRYRARIRRTPDESSGRAPGERCPTTRKVTFATEREALAVVGEATARNGGQARKVPRRAYVCFDCGFWHITAT